MPVLRHLVAGVAAIVLLPACAGSRAAAPAPAPALRAPDAVRAAQAEVLTLSEVNGQVLAELGVGSGHGYELGTLLRVYRPGAAGASLAGMLQVTELIGADRCIARLIGLTDRATPLHVGDHVRPVIDLSENAAAPAPAPAPAAARPAAPAASAPAPAAPPAPDLPTADEARFGQLRAHYQRELELLDQRHRRELAESAQRQQAAEAGLRAQGERALAAQAAQHRLDLAAAANAKAEELKAALAADRAQRDGKLRDAMAERDQSRVQIEVLARELQRQQQRHEQLVAESARREEQYRTGLRAEVETRQVLDRRIAELEARTSGAALPPPVLTNDPNRNETLLERLNRLAEELARSQAHAGTQAGALAAAQRQAEADRAEIARLRETAARLADNQGETTRLGRELAGAQGDLKRAAEERAAQELARLEAERTWYDLSARVLRLANADELRDLQGRLRHHLAAQPATPRAVEER